MQKMRMGLLTLTASAAVAVALCVGGPSFAKGGGAGGGGSSGSKGGAATKPTKKSLYDVISEDTSLSKFLAALKAAELDAELKKDGSYTVLAPNDAAFGKLDPAKLAELQKPENKAKWKAVIAGHIVSGKMKEADIVKATKLTCGGASHAVKVGDDKKPTIDGAKIVKADVEGSNGFVQIIDTVLVPEEKPAAEAPEGGGK